MPDLDRLRELWRRRGPWGLLTQAATWPLRKALRFRCDLEFEAAVEELRAALARRPMQAPLTVQVVRGAEVDAAISAGLRINPHSRIGLGQGINLATVAATAAGEVVGVWVFQSTGELLRERSCMVSPAWRGQGVARGLLAAALEVTSCTNMVAACEFNNRSAERMLRSTGLRPVRVRMTVRTPEGRVRTRSWPLR